MGLVSLPVILFLYWLMLHYKNGALDVPVIGAQQEINIARDEEGLKE